MQRLTVSQNAAVSATARRGGGLAAVLAAALAVGGCSAASVIDSLPTEVGGLPANAPKRLETQPQYPAVNDVRERGDKPLTTQQQLRLEEELSEIRARQSGLQNKGAISRAQAEAEKTNAARTRAIKAAKGSKRAADEAR